MASEKRWPERWWPRLFVMLLLLAGCDYKGTVIRRAEPDCSGKEEQVRSFILECIRAANPRADEEPEDWIGLCERMAWRTHCSFVRGFERWMNQRVVEYGSCLDADEQDEIAACGGRRFVGKQHSPPAGGGERR
jgi:hypothetical protein